MKGYFQSFKYFHPNYTEEIKREFEFLPVVQDWAQRIVDKALREHSNSTLIAVHVRRGMDVTLNLRFVYRIDIQ